MTPMLSSRILCAVAMALCCAGAGVARGDAFEDAKRFAKQAAIHYQLGRFADASEAYTRSYELAPLPGLLFNLGQCQLALKSFDRALFFFEGYLREKPDAPNLALVRDLIAEARKERTEQQAKAAEAEAERRAALHHVIPAPPAPPRDKRRIPAVGLGAASLAMLGFSVYLGLRSDMASDYERLTGNGSLVHDEFHKDRVNYAIAAGVTGSLALGAAIASGVLGYLGWRPPKHANIVVSPTATGGAATLSGSF